MDQRIRIMTDAQQFAVFETEAGFCAIAWTAGGIARFQLPDSTAAAAERGMLRKSPAARPGTPPADVATVIAAAQRYFAGEAVDFSEIALDLDDQDEFFRRIYGALRQVGYGKTTTYGTLAKELGAGPEVARDVGQAMAKNPIPLIIPCHRVLAAGNKVGGFSAPGGADSKVKMLALEGIDLSPPPPAQQSLGF
jgi:methylated-DNA-[protein]-cysteine S-methyltransferase